MKLTRSKDLNKILRDVERAGAHLTSRGNHVQIHYHGKTITVSGSPSDRRAIQNIRSDLRRVGL